MNTKIVEGEEGMIHISRGILRQFFYHILIEEN
jgi:hypothetical protein